MQDRSDMTPKKYMALILIFVSLLILFWTFLRIPFILNSYLTYNLIFYLNLASILVFTIGIMFDSWESLFICTLGSVIGEWCFCLIHGCGEETPVFLIFMVLSPGLSGMLISVLRKNLRNNFKNEIIAMIIGGIWQYVGLMIGAFFWYFFVLDYTHIIVLVAYPLFSTIFDLFLIPVSLILNEILRRAFKFRYFNGELQYILKKN